MAFLDANDIRIHYEISGSADLPVLVFSHSLGVNLAMWEPQLPAVAERFRLLRYDTRGHGESSVPSGQYSIDELGTDVLALLDALEIRQASFCGLSMGGVVGQWFGVHASHRLHKLVLANTAAKIGTDETWNSRIATVERDGLSSVIPGTIERWFTAGFRLAQSKVTAKTEAMLRNMSPQGYIGCCAALRDTDLRGHVQTIDVPVLVITGNEDPVTPPDEAQFLAGAIADATYVELGAAHLSNVEAAASFNAALLAFLTS